MAVDNATAVAEQIAASRANADATLAQAIAAVNDISVPRISQIGPFALDVDYQTQANSLTNFELEDFDATAPTADIQDFSVGNPSDVDIPDPSVGTVPTDDVGSFTASFPPTPALQEFDPPDTPILSTVEIPDEPTLTYPDDPVLLEIPDFDDINITLPTFSAVAPSAITDQLDPDLDLTNERYSSALLTEIKTQISDVFSNGTNLPEAIADALFDRTVWREDREAARARRQVNKDFAARGFAHPPGALAKALLDIEKTGLETRSRINLEQYVERWRQEVELIREYTALGIQLEAQLIEEHNQFFQRALRFAEVKLNTAVAIFNARIQRYNLQIEVFRAQIEQYRAELEVELSKLEEMKIRADIAQSKAQTNRAIVDAYRSQVDAVNSRIQIYATQIDAARVQAQINGELVNQYRAEIEAYRSQIEAAKTDVEIYGEVVNAERVKADVFNSRVQAYATRVQAYRTEVDAANILAGIDIEKARLELEKYRARLQREESAVDRDVKTLQAEIDLYRAEIAKFQALVDQKASLSNANDRKSEILISDAKARADLALASAQLQERYLSNSTEQAVRAMIAIAEISGELSAAAQNAVNASATLCSTAA